MPRSSIDSVVGPAAVSPASAAKRCRSWAAVAGSVESKYVGACSKLAQPIVDAAVQVQHVHMFLQQVDRGQEPFALQAVLVQILRRRIGGGDQRHAAPEQALEQSRENHRIGDVRDEEFIQTQDPRGSRQPFRDGLERLRALGGGAQFRVHLSHEAIEVNASRVWFRAATRRTNP